MTISARGCPFPTRKLGRVERQGGGDGKEAEKEEEKPAHGSGERSFETYVTEMQGFSGEVGENLRRPERPEGLPSKQEFCTLCTRVSKGRMRARASFGKDCAFRAAGWPEILEIMEKGFRVELRCN